MQQNHDGLPQKAGYPQQHLNEIHGAWFDPTNPVVPMSGTLREDLMTWLLDPRCYIFTCMIYCILSIHAIERHLLGQKALFEAIDLLRIAILKPLRARWST